MERLIRTLADQGVLPREKAQALVRDLPVARPADAPGGAGAAGSPATIATTAGGAAAAPGTVRVGLVPQFVRDELKRELRAELSEQARREGWAPPNSVPAWTRGVTVEGDVRVRAQADLFADGNAPAVGVTETNRNRTPTLVNTSEDRQRLRVRARVAVNATLDPNWSAGLRLTTGSLTDPLSSNQTLGSYGNRFTAAFDRAFVRWRWMEHLNAVAGRFGNPWFGTDLVWANDLGFDGVAAQWTPDLGPAGRAFLTAAVMPVQEVELSARDKWLYGLQVGADLPRLFGRVGVRLAAGYYHYSGLTGVLSPPGSTRNEFTAPAFAQKGNTYFNIASDPARPLLGLAADYRLVNLTGQLALPLGDHRLVVAGDWVRNIGFDRAAVAARTGFAVGAQVTGWQLRAAYGHGEVAQPGQWQLFGGYKYLERDAVPDAFTDSDFRLGGTDARGYFLGGTYGLGRQSVLTLRWLSGDSISGPPLAVDVLQMDVNVRF
jgi:hypothetical protein